MVTRNPADHCMLPSATRPRNLTPLIRWLRNRAIDHEKEKLLKRGNAIWFRGALNVQRAVMAPVFVSSTGRRGAVFALLVLRFPRLNCVPLTGVCKGRPYTKHEHVCIARMTKTENVLAFDDQDAED